MLASKEQPVSDNKNEKKVRTTPNLKHETQLSRNLNKNILILILILSAINKAIYIEVANLDHLLCYKLFRAKYQVVL
ncbi:hypothetical protein BDW_04085 [Bdellovibrio bacteriovorus W]|nr:hypothetical protein BDW_04085 [Bdellovibrio bacteriovorus W]